MHGRQGERIGIDKKRTGRSPRFGTVFRMSFPPLYVRLTVSSATLFVYPGLSKWNDLHSQLIPWPRDLLGKTALVLASVTDKRSIVKCSHVLTTLSGKRKVF